MNEKAQNTINSEFHENAEVFSIFANKILQSVNQKQAMPDQQQEQNLYELEVDSIELLSSQQVYIYPKKIKKTNIRLSNKYQNKYKVKQLPIKKKQNHVAKIRSYTRRNKINGKIGKPQNINELHIVLKQYFEKYLEKVLDKLQNTTNQKLQQMMRQINKINGKIDRLEKIIYIKQQQTNRNDRQLHQYHKHNHEFEDPDSAQIEFEQNIPKYGNKNNKKLSTYFVPNSTKMHFINLIERNQMTTLNVARQLNLSQRAVQMWLRRKEDIKDKIHKEIEPKPHLPYRGNNNEQPLQFDNKRR